MNAFIYGIVISSEQMLLH